MPVPMLGAEEAAAEQVDGVAAATTAVYVSKLGSDTTGSDLSAHFAGRLGAVVKVNRPRSRAISGTRSSAQTAEEDVKAAEEATPIKHRDPVTQEPIKCLQHLTDFQNMVATGMAPNSSELTAAINAVAPDEAINLFEEMVKNGEVPNAFSPGVSTERLVEEAV